MRFHLKRVVVFILATCFIYVFLLVVHNTRMPMSSEDKLVEHLIASEVNSNDDVHKLKMYRTDNMEPNQLDGKKNNHIPDAPHDLNGNIMKESKQGYGNVGNGDDGDNNGVDNYDGNDNDGDDDAGGVGNDDDDKDDGGGAAIDDNNDGDNDTANDFDDNDKADVDDSNKDQTVNNVHNQPPLVTDRPDIHSLFPHQIDMSDRIEAQMNFKVPVKGNMTILMLGRMHNTYMPGNNRFLTDRCQMTNCFLTQDRNNMFNSSAILFVDYVPDYFQETFRGYKTRFNRDQVRIFYQLESPFNSDSVQSFGNFINWTATYRMDSVIPAPYAYFSFYKSKQIVRPDVRNYSAKKTKMATWFVSNCKTPNNRSGYVQELQRYIQVDVYGACGTLLCPKQMTAKCFDRLKTDYMFYLAFENGNCRGYITEKLFINALQHDVIPVVMGAPLEDYQRLAPPNSFIHVDEFKSPKHLATYLRKVAGNDTLYNSYFQWKSTGSFINTKFWCRLCAMLNVGAQFPMWYDDLATWWDGPGVCADASTARWASWREAKVSREAIWSSVKYGYRPPGP